MLWDGGLPPEERGQSRRLNATMGLSREVCYAGQTPTGCGTVVQWQNFCIRYFASRAIPPHPARSLRFTSEQAFF